LLIFALNVIA